jgi:hypothetical protein
LGDACGVQIAPKVAFQGGVCCTSPPLSQWWGACSRSWHGRALDTSFSLPPSLLLRNRVVHCKKKKVWLFICEVKLSFFFYCNVFSLDLFIELICFFNFISWHLIFIYDLVLILLIEIYLVLNHLLSYFFLFHTFTLDFCIRFYFYSFNYGVFGLESLIKLICLWISNIILTDPHFFYC